MGKISDRNNSIDATAHTCSEAGCGCIIIFILITFGIIGVLAFLQKYA